MRTDCLPGTCHRGRRRGGTCCTVVHRRRRADQEAPDAPSTATSTDLLGRYRRLCSLSTQIGSHSRLRGPLAILGFPRCSLVFLRASWFSSVFHWFSSPWRPYGPTLWRNLICTYFRERIPRHSGRKHQYFARVSISEAFAREIEEQTMNIEEHRRKYWNPGSKCLIRKVLIKVIERSSRCFWPISHPEPGAGSQGKNAHQVFMKHPPSGRRDVTRVSGKHLKRVKTYTTAVQWEAGQVRPGSGISQAFSREIEQKRWNLIKKHKNPEIQSRV